MLLEKAEKLEKEFNDLEPKDQWKWLIGHADLFTVWLDNDTTYVTFNAAPSGNEGDDWPHLYADDDDQWIGNAPGLDSLLGVLGFNVRSV